MHLQRQRKARSNSSILLIGITQDPDNKNYMSVMTSPFGGLRNLTSMDDDGFDAFELFRHGQSVGSCPECNQSNTWENWCRRGCP